MVAFLASVIATVGLTVIAFLVLRRRPKGTPLTWGEAFVAATFVWTILLLAYAIVPHQFITMCDKDFGWRSDVFGIPTGPLPFKDRRLFADGITFMGRGRVLVSEQTIRDFLVSGIYIVFLVAHVVLWGKAQNRGQKKADVVPVSPYGRPLIRKVEA